MTAERVATCACGALVARCSGDPVRVSVCHCHDCQRRSGSAFAVQARFPAAAVRTTGEALNWSRTGDSGGVARFHFCPACGSTLWYETESPPGLIAVPVGAFAAADFPGPSFSVYERRRKAWVAIAGPAVAHLD